jgi:filamentous hemagglutinin
VGQLATINPVGLADLVVSGVEQVVALSTVVQGVAGVSGGDKVANEVSATFSNSQLDKKFKHADDFGISTTKKNPETLSQYQAAIESHLSNASTYAHGTYQYVPGSTVYFNPVTNNVVIIGKDGSFVSGWKLAPGTTQFENFIKNGVLR